MGSGKLIKRAIKKHGLESFTKEILFVFDNEHQMNLKEKELVVVDENSYNLCEGGKGGVGFGYINKQPEKKIWVKKGRIATNKILNERNVQKAKDRYNNSAKICLFCDQKISYEKRINVFCNHSCSVKYNNILRVSN